MTNIELFTAALGLQSPWQIVKVDFTEVSENTPELHLWIDFQKGHRFTIDGTSSTAYDTKDRTWRHLNFFQHKCFIHCPVPRVKTGDGSIHVVSVPWARKGSGFTLLFEAFALELIRSEMPVSRIGELLGENPNRIWTIFRYHVGIAYQAADHSSIEVLGLDETSVRKGHQYITLGVDMQERSVVRVVTGKGAASVLQIADYLKTKGSPPEKVRHVCMDMSPAFISGVGEGFPEAAITFDRYHVKALLNQAMNEVRKAEGKEHARLKGHKYTFLRNNSTLSERKRKERDELITLFPTLGEAYRLKVLFDDFWDFEDPTEAEDFLKDWCKQAKEAKINPYLKIVNTLKAHWSGIVNYIKSKINNGILEGINSKIQLAKRRARGYSNLQNLSMMIYLIAGNLIFNHPHKTA